MINAIIIGVSSVFLIFGLGLMRIYKREKHENSGVMGVIFITTSICILISLYLAT